MKNVNPKVQRYQRAAKKVSQREDKSRPFAVLVEKYELELRSELDLEAELDKMLRRRAIDDLNSLRKIGQAEVFGIITISPLLSMEYCPLLLLKDEDANIWELREAPLRVVSLWAKQLASDIAEAEAELERFVDDKASEIGGLSGLKKKVKALEKEFKNWCSRERSRGRDEDDMRCGTFLVETGRFNPPEAQSPERESVGRFEDLAPPA